MEPVSNKPAVYLVSACLVGLATRYDGGIFRNKGCLHDMGGRIWIPFCPEQLGGLPTPRPAADLVGGDGRDVLAGRARVVTREGQDITAAFLRGAGQVLEIARSHPVDAVFLKSRSPSCGLSPVIGVTAALLMEHGFRLREY